MVFRVSLILVFPLLQVDGFLLKACKLLQLTHSDGMTYKDLPYASGPSHYDSDAHPGRYVSVQTIQPAAANVISRNAFLQYRLRLTYRSNIALPLPI